MVRIAFGHRFIVLWGLSRFIWRFKGAEQSDVEKWSGHASKILGSKQDTKHDDFRAKVDLKN
jgi:hypothetical protein